MTRYVSLTKPPRNWTDDDGDWWPDGPPTISVLQEDDSPRPTGLLDKRGVEIYEMRDRPKIGF